MKRPSRLVLSASLALALALATGAGAAPAPVPNPGFEAFAGVPTVPAQWSAGGTGNLLRDTTRKHSGAASLQLGAIFGAFAAHSDCFAVSPSTTYFLSYYYYTTDPAINTVSGTVRWFTDAACTNVLPGDLTATTIATVDTIGTAFHIFQGSGTSPATGMFGWVQLGDNCDLGILACAANFDDVVLDTTPTAVTVSSLAARRSNGGVDVTWRTGATADTLGFNVWRSGSRTGAYTKLNRFLIAAHGTTYRYRDRTARWGTRYFYELQVVRLDGSRRWAGTVGPA